MPVNKGLFHRTEREETGQRVAVAAANVVLLLSAERDPDGATGRSHRAEPQRPCGLTSKLIHGAASSTQGCCNAAARSVLGLRLRGTTELNPANWL